MRSRLFPRAIRRSGEVRFCLFDDLGEDSFPGSTFSAEEAEAKLLESLRDSVRMAINQARLELYT